MDALINYKGLADIAVGIILSVKPEIIYNSAITRKISALTGLHVSNANLAPGFNQALASMVMSIGVGHLVASVSGKEARPTIFAMNLTWGILSLATCFTPKKWGIGSATICMTALNHLGFSAALYYMWKSPVQKRKKSKDKK
ncbi:hypothetical protein C8J56DRAFT_187768 [Mycena floridula]|nr:hypothetical protein C8J56DRAFT_187768 [Mycena floridula]